MEDVKIYLINYLVNHEHVSRRRYIISLCGILVVPISS